MVGAATVAAVTPCKHDHTLSRRDHPDGLPAGSEAEFITGEQLTRATGIA
jgi:hypothetical protein